MRICIEPSRLSGTVTPPAGKSELHRLIICAALARGESSIYNTVFSDDVLATLGCASVLGAKWRREENRLIISGAGGERREAGMPVFDCGESGSTLRFMIPTALVLYGGGIFTGRGRLMERPLEPYLRIFRERGIKYALEKDRLCVSGRLESGEYRLTGEVSSQFFSGLLLALPLAGGKSEIISETEVESAEYIYLTEKAMTLAGISCGADERKFSVSGGEYRSFQCSAEADWSQAAFWYAANSLGADIEINGLNPDSQQPDRRIRVFSELLSRDGDIEINTSQCPDIVPPLALMAAVRCGKCGITGASRLRYKESDRLKTVSSTLKALGADITETADGMEIRGRDMLTGGETDCIKDHRVAMMAAVAATRCRERVILNGAECISKSYPGFLEEYKRLGGAVYAFPMGK